jgi:phosphoserine aminotransferase
MTQRNINFSAGPAALPLPVLEQVQEQLLVYPGAGASIMEISHRSKTFLAVLETAKNNIKTLLQLPDNYHVLFIPGGASLQFTMFAMNFLDGGTADYIHTGSWGTKAIQAAGKHGTARLAWSGKEGNFTRNPTNEELDLDSNAQYVHYTSNETIQGIEFDTEPETGGKPLFCDASSNFLSKPLDIEKYALLYAGAQKNVGPSGVAVAIVRDDLLERIPKDLPAMLDYGVMVKNDSLYNTPPTFAIYVISLVTQWILDDMGGLEKMAEINRNKAGLLYDVIDNSGGYYRGHAEAGSRSNMNVSFRAGDEAAEAEFVAEATKAGLDGLKGHRSVGGCRASIYNAMPVAGVETLRDFMLDSQRRKG